MYFSEAREILFMKAMCFNDATDMLFMKTVNLRGV
jgi:hypothetical protein